MKFLLSPSNDPYYNLALEDYLLHHSKENVLLCYVNKPSVVVGRFQLLYNEIDVPLSVASNICLVRRMSGGGTVFHDEGNLNYSFHFNNESVEGESYDFFNSLTLSVLRDLGLSNLSFQRNNIFCEDLKVSGVAQCKRGNRMVHHGTLLVDADLTFLRRLFAKKDGYTSKGVSSVSSHVANVSQFISIEMPEVMTAFAKLCEGEFTSVLDEDWIRDKQVYYQDDEWVVGGSPAYTLQRGDVTMHVKKGVVQSVSPDVYSHLEGKLHSLALYEDTPELF